MKDLELTRFMVLLSSLQRNKATANKMDPPGSCIAQVFDHSEASAIGRSKVIVRAAHKPNIIRR